MQHAADLREAPVQPGVQQGLGRGPAVRAHRRAVQVDHHEPGRVQPALVAARRGDGDVPLVHPHREVAAGRRRPAARGELADVGDEFGGAALEGGGVVGVCAHRPDSTVGRNSGLAAYCAGCRRSGRFGAIRLRLLRPTVLQPGAQAAVAIAVAEVDHQPEQRPADEIRQCSTNGCQNRYRQASTAASPSRLPSSGSPASTWPAGSIGLRARS